ncbi:MAG: replicative DNA helicase [Myxococcales bacterium]|nr:replicative DNA helicase [Myxococcales bacterium]
MNSTSSQQTPSHTNQPSSHQIQAPPANVEAERAILGAVLLDDALLSVVLEYVKADDFYRDAHRTIFEAMCDLFDTRVPIEPLTVSERLRETGKLETVGGASYVASLLGSVTGTAAVDHYAKLVREKAMTRRMIYAASEIVSLGYGGGLPTREFLDRSEKLVFDVLDSGQRSSVQHIKEVLKTAITKVQSLFEQREGVTGLTTGFERIDRLTLGLQASDLIILAARPAMGKTTFALNLACNAALAARAAVVVFSLEMGADQLVLRLLSAESRIELSKLRSGQLSDSDWPKLANAAAKLSEARIYIDETPGITPIEVRSRARRLKLEGNCDLVVIDYLQLMNPSRSIASREQQISEISRSLKGLAKELHVPVIALSQLNRGLESRTDKRPMMSDLRESGAIEQDADIISFIYRDEVYHPESKDQGIAEIIIAKHRNGPTGTVRVKFFNTFTRFDNLYEE